MPKPVNSADKPWPSSDRVRIKGAETLSDHWGRLTKYNIAYRRRDGVTEHLGLILLPGQGGAQGVESRWHLAPAPSRALLWSDEDSFTLTRLRARLLPPASWSLHATPKGEVLEPLPLPDL